MHIPAQQKNQSTICSTGSVLRVCVIAGTLLLGACTTDGVSFSNLGMNNVDWFTASKTTEQGSISLSRDVDVLADGNVLEVSVHNAVELARQKRFVEARYLLAGVRDLQDPKEDGYRAVTCAMAILALRDGDIRTFKRTARQLDTALGMPVNVTPSYVEVISLYRVLTKQSLPVNAPEGMQRLKEHHFPTQSADL